MALAPSSASAEAGRAELLGIARPCNLLSWAFQPPDSETAPLQQSEPVTEPSMQPASTSSLPAAAAASPVGEQAGEQLLSASFSPGAAWLLLVYPAAWHLLQRSTAWPAAFTPTAACSAPAADLSQSLSTGQLQWAGALLHTLGEPAAPGVIAWDSAACVHTGSQPGTAAVQLAPAGGSWHLEQLTPSLLAAVPCQVRLGGQQQQLGSAHSAVLLSVADGGSLQLTALQQPAEPPDAAQAEGTSAPDQGGTCTMALAAGNGAQASYVQVRSCLLASCLSCSPPDSPAAELHPRDHCSF